MVAVMIRAREIVSLAASKAKTEFTRAWLFSDERGIWEQLATIYLADVDPEKQVKLGMSDADVNAEIAVRLCIEAAETQLRHKRSTAPVCS